jgi:integrase
MMNMAGLIITNRGDKKNPKWQYRFELAKVDGKRRYASKSGFKTKEECEKAGNLALAEYLRAGKHFEPSEMSVSDYLDYWLNNYCVVNLADNTVSSYTNIVNNHLKPRIGHFMLKSIDVMTLQNMINDIYLNRGYTKAFLGNILKVCKGAFGYAAYTAKLIPYNIAEPVKLPKFEPQEKKPRILSKEQMEAVLDRFRNSPYQYNAMLIGYYTGMRIGEVYGLTWDDIDLENGILHVRQQCKVKDKDAMAGRKPQKGKALNRWYLGALKNNSSYRSIKIGAELTNALIAYKELQDKAEAEYGEFYVKHYLKEEKLANGRTEHRIISQTDESGICPYPRVKLVCVKENGEFRGTVPMKYVAKVVKTEMGFEDFHFHMLRHTHATVLVSNTEELQIKDISERLGHSSIKTTMDTYVSNTDEMRVKSMEIFEKVGKLNVKRRNERLYEIWKATKNRCNGTSFYKDRGIKFFDAWLDYEVFEQWALENGYEDDLSLIRKDKALDFCPTNCMWSSDTRNVRGKNIWTDGKNIKSYSIKHNGYSWGYAITNYDEHGKRKDIQKSIYKTEQEAKDAAEAVLAEMFSGSEVLLKRIK